MVKVNIESVYIGTSDCGPYRSIEFGTYGNTLEECLEMCTIVEVNQDGEEMDCYGIDKASNKHYDIIESFILDILVLQKCS